MAITANQIDNTIVKVGNDMLSLRSEAEIFVKNYAGYAAGVKTAVKAHVAARCTTARADLQDIIDAINALP